VDVDDNNTAVMEMLEPEMAELLAEFLDKIKGQNMGIKDMMGVMADFRKRLPPGKVFSQEEKNAIMEAALGAMPEEERNRYKMLLKTIKAI